MNLNRREYCGLENQGSTCYLNVVLQTLYMTKEYRDHFKRPRIRHDSSDGKFIEELKGLFNKLDKKEGPVRPSGITRILGINVNVQLDAAEHLELILSKTPEYSKIFMGMMQKTRTCLNKQCLNKTPSQTKFCMLQISPDESQDVEDALNAYLKPREQNGLYCRACKKQNKMTTDSTIIDFPKILILQLQENVDFTNSTYECTYKGNLKVNFRSHIEVLHHKYELYAIVRRFGSFNSGHYNVDIKSEDQTWYLFDDSTVLQSDFNKFSEISTERHLSCSNIYLLVYRDQSEMERTKEHERRQHEALRSPKTSTYRHATQKSDENYRSPREDPKLNSGQNENSDIYMSYRLNLKRKYQKVHEETHTFFIEEPSVGTQWIKYNDIFKASRNIRTVLTKGEADTGKIPSVVKFILDWTDGNANQDIKYIFPIQFKELNLIAETELNLLELVQNSCESTGNLILEESDKVLIILDGLHEAQFMLDFNYKKQISYFCSVSVVELLTNLIEGSMFPNVLIWITSHPAAANNIPLKYVNLVTRDYDLNQRTSSDQSDSNTTTHKNISFKTQSPSVTNAGKGGADEQQKSEEAKMLKSSTGEDGCAYLTPDVGSNPSHLRELDLSENHFGGSGKKLLSDILADPQYKLEKLLLRSCSIREEVCAVLSSALKSHLSHLRELDLSNNSFGDLGLKRLSALLTDPQCKLEKLLLRSCSIGEEGCAVLSTALRSNPSNVRELDLSGNLIEGQGMKLLLDRLADPLCKLEKLGLCSCIKEEGCAALTSNTSSKRFMYK